MAEVPSHMRGAETETVRDNPTVHSKFDRSQGKGLKAPHLSHPGEVAPLTGTHVKGHTPNGHMLPKHIAHVNQHDTVKASPRMGTQVKSHKDSGASDNVVKRASSKQGPGVLAGAKRT